jgi:cell division protein FtsZ
MVREDANIILGSVIDDTLGDKIVVTVIATGFEKALDQETVIKKQDLTSDVKEKAGILNSNLSEKNEKDVIKSFMDINTKDMENKQEEDKERIVLDEQGTSVVLEEDELDTPTFLRKKHQELEKIGKQS